MKDSSRNSKILNEKSYGSIDLAQTLVNTIREPLVILDHEHKIITANPNFYSSFEVKENDAKGQLIYQLGNGQWKLPKLRELLEEGLPQQGQTNNFEFFLDFPTSGKRKFSMNSSRMGWENDPLVLLTFQDVTKDSYSVDQKRNYQKIVRDILAHAPAMICTLRGPEHVFELANEKYLQLMGNRDIFGKPVREAVPEVENQGFIEILDQVYETGIPYVGNEVPLKLKAPGNKLQRSFVDFVYQPTFDFDKNIDGIFVHIVDVTEKVLAKKKIAESENRLRKIIDTAPVMLWITTKNGHSTYLNENWYKYTGQAQKEAEGFGWLKAVHPDEREEAEMAFKQSNDKQEPYHKTFKLKNSKGEYRWVLDSGMPKYNDDGQFDGMIGTVVDIHEDKVKEQLIKEKEHRIRSIIEEAPVATALYTGKEIKIELANEAMIKLWGKDSSVIGKKLRQALPELKGQPFHRLLEEVYSTGKTYWGKEEKVDLMINEKMQTGFFDFTYKALRDEKGEIYGILNMAVDVTEQVNSRNLLKQSESHFRQMAELLPDKIINTDPKGEILYLNQNWVEYTGLSREELHQNFWSALIHPDDKERVRNSWEKSLDTGMEFDIELRLLNKKRQYKWHLSRAQAVKDEKGKIKMWIGCNTEIHKLKEEEKRKENFLKMVSHELKTPVTSIKGYVQLLLSVIKNGKHQQISSLPLEPSLERIDYQIVRLTRLISEMLDLSRLEDNKLELQKKKFNINELVTDTVQDITYTNTQHKIEILHDFKCDVYADKDRIGQVLINLITNAIKYSPNSQNVTVKIQKARNSQVSISVKDQGVGIDQKNHKNIFRRFYRIGGKSEETYSGFGIGLYLANEIIERHDGSMQVKSKKGKGSEFSFTLSIAPENKAPKK